MSRRLAFLICLAPALLCGSFELTGPKVAKIGWKTRSLTAADIDADGRTDLAVINNDRARIEMLYQRQPGEKPPAETRPERDRWEPILEDAPFDVRHLTTGIQMYALAIGDLNRDQRPDLVYTGNPDQLTVRYQDRKGRFPKKRVFEVGEPVTYISSILIADVDDDGSNELALLTQEQLMIFEFEDDSLTRKRSYALSNDACDAMSVFDANADGKTDISYQVPQEQDRLRVRFGGGSGAFGPEHMFRLDEVGGTLQPIVLPDSSAPSFVRVQWHTGLIEFLSLEHAQAEDSLLGTVRPRVFSAQSPSNAEATWVLADLDGNGLDDIVMADFRNASIRTVQQSSAATFSEPREYPALSDIRGLAAGDIDGDGRDEIIVASPREKTVAIAGLTKRGRLAYPTPVPTEGKPWDVVSADFDGDGVLEIAYTYDEKRDKGAVILRRDSTKSDWVAHTFTIEDMRSGPRGLRAVDANRDGRLDLAVFAPHEALRLLLQHDEFSFVEADVESGFRKGLINDVEASGMTLGDITGDGVDEILVADKGYARALQVSADGTLTVVDQINARSPDSEISAAVVADLDGEGSPEVILILGNDNGLEVLGKRSDEVYAFIESVPLGQLDLVEAQVRDIDGNDKPDLLLFGADRLLWLPLEAADLDLIAKNTFETDIKDVTHRLLAVGDFDQDGIDDIIGIDSRDTHILEMISAGEKGAWTSTMHFKIFDVDPHYEGQRGSASEPSELVVADFDDNGSDDLALLVHDRILVYTTQ